MIALCGNRDGLVTPAQMEAWRSCTDADFELHILSGGHLHILTNTEPVNRILHYLLASLVARAGDEASTVLEARLGEEEYGFMLRRTDIALLAAVDECLGSRLHDSDRLACLSAWFSGPLPDLGVPLGLDLAMRGALPSPLRRTVQA